MILKHARRHLTAGSVAALLVFGAGTVSCRAQEKAPPPEHLSSSTDSWAFEPTKDAFSSTALLDLRPLNEKTAGESGYITRSPDGADFATGNKKPIRFWGVS